MKSDCSFVLKYLHFLLWGSGFLLSKHFAGCLLFLTHAFIQFAYLLDARMWGLGLLRCFSVWLSSARQISLSRVHLGLDEQKRIPSRLSETAELNFPIHQFNKLCSLFCFGFFCARQTNTVFRERSSSLSLY